MKKLLQYTFTVLLILTLGVSGLSYFIFDVAQVELRKEARHEAAENRGIQIIKITGKAFAAQKDKDEVWIDGALYDVSSYTTEGEYVVLTVLHDKHEESLINQLVESIENSATTSADNGNHFSKHKVHLPDNGKIMPIGFSVSNNRISEATSIYLHDVAVFYPDNFSSIIKPPDLG